MLRRLRAFFDRPLAADFSFRTQLIWAIQSGLVVMGILLLFGHLRVSAAGPSHWVMIGLLTGGMMLAIWTAGYVLPQLLPRFFDEDRWTVGQYVIHLPILLLLVTLSVQIVLTLTGNAYASFGVLYKNVALFGIFPTTLDLLLTEQRRLRRNLAQARLLNKELDRTPSSNGAVDRANLSRLAAPERVQLTSENGRDRLSLPPDQLRYVESVGNYVEVHWLNGEAVQKTTLRSTLREVEATLAAQPAFFRCHRAFLVNLSAVCHADGNSRGYQLTLADSDAQIPVSRSYVGAFDERMKIVSRS